MKTLKAAGCCGAALALIFAATPCVQAQSMEDAQVSAGAMFDNTGTQTASVGDSGVPGGPGGQIGPTVLTVNGSSSHITSDAPAPPPPSSLMKKVGSMPGVIKANWKTLSMGAAAGALLGVGFGSAIPIAGPVVGGIIGAVIGAGLFTGMGGDDKGARMGEVMTTAGVGAMMGMAYGSAFPIIGTAIGGIAGAIFGGVLGFLATK
ncbi:MAG: hypothetical protein HKL90_07560 [Elusimicrobia bacterium]|nr:hypothetical protein [Elusimicrobiota bacterium]